MNNMYHQNQENYCAETKAWNGIRIPVLSECVWKHLENAEGEILYPLTNDRMFRGAVSYSEKVQRGLASILLEMDEREIVSVRLLNPVSFGHAANDKKTEEDVTLVVNEDIVLDIEVQNVWVETNSRRFLLYLCRNFDSIREGKEYNDLKSNLMIGVLNYRVNEEQPEFYAEYRLMNTRTMRPLFTENENYFGFNIMDLGASGLADAGDKASGRVTLAKLFRTSDWERLRKLCQEVSPVQPFVKEVAGIMSIANADERERVELESARRHAERMADLDARMERLTKSEAEARRNEAAAQKRAENLEKENAVLREKIKKLEEQDDS